MKLVILFIVFGVSSASLLSSLRESISGSETTSVDSKSKSPGLFSGVGSDALAAAYGRVKTNFQGRIAALRARRQEFIGGKLKAFDDDIKEMEERLEGLNPNTRTGRFGLRMIKSALTGLESRVESILAKVGNVDKVKPKLDSSIEKLESPIDDP